MYFCCSNWQTDKTNSYKRQSVEPKNFHKSTGNKFYRNDVYEEAIYTRTNICVREEV